MSTIKVGSLVRFPSEEAKEKAINRVPYTCVNGTPLNSIPITVIFKVTERINTSCRIVPINCKKTY